MCGIIKMDKCMLFDMKKFEIYYVSKVCEGGV